MLTGPLSHEIKRHMPKDFLRWYKCRKWEPLRKHYAALGVAEAFTEIYRTKLWGAPDGYDFFSGGGSGLLFASAYADRVVRFIADHQIRSLVDLGCGDFQVGRRITAASDVRYLGVDVVPNLVAYNQSHFGGPRVEFRRANIIEDVGEVLTVSLCVGDRGYISDAARVLTWTLHTVQTFEQPSIREYSWTCPLSASKPRLSLIYRPRKMIRSFARSSWKRRAGSQLGMNETYGVPVHYIVYKGGFCAAQRDHAEQSPSDEVSFS